MKDDRFYLVDMLEIARRVQQRVTGISRKEFEENENLQLATAHLLQNIGEAVRLVSQPTRDAFPNVPWKAITGMRHKIVHDYFKVRFDIVWSTACEIGELILIRSPVVDPIIEQMKSEKQRENQ